MRKTYECLVCVAVFVLYLETSNLRFVSLAFYLFLFEVNTKKNQIPHYFEYAYPKCLVSLLFLRIRLCKPKADNNLPHAV